MSACDRLHQIAISGSPNGTEAINVFICIADSALQSKDSRCCLETLSDLVEKLRGLSGLNVVRTSEQDVKANQVQAYIRCLVQQLEAAGHR